MNKEETAVFLEDVKNKGYCFAAKKHNLSQPKVIELANSKGVFSSKNTVKKNLLLYLKELETNNYTRAQIICRLRKIAANKNFLTS